LYFLALLFLALDEGFAFMMGQKIYLLSNACHGFETAFWGLIGQVRTSYNQANEKYAIYCCEG